MREETPVIATDTASLAEQVRSRVREEGIDPVRESTVVRQIAEDVARAHDERSLTGAVAPLDDLSRVVGDLVSSVSGFGPLQAYLDDPTVEEIWVNEPSRVFVARHGCHELTTMILTAEEVRELVERMLKSSGRRLDLSQPFVDATLPGGHRLHVVLEGISRGYAAINIRKFVARAHSLVELVDLQTLTPHAAEFLHASVLAGLNIVVSGGTQSGKTTMLNCLAASIPGTDRVVSCEEVFELRYYARLHTCEHLSIPAKAWIAPAWARPLKDSARTARSCVRSAAGTSSRSSPTTTCRHRRPSLGRRTSGCSPHYGVVRPRSSWHGMSTGSHAS